MGSVECILVFPCAAQKSCARCAKVMNKSCEERCVSWHIYIKIKDMCTEHAAREELHSILSMGEVFFFFWCIYGEVWTTVSIRLFILTDVFMWSIFILFQFHLFSNDCYHVFGLPVNVPNELVTAYVPGLMVLTGSPQNRIKQPPVYSVHCHNNPTVSIRLMSLTNTLYIQQHSPHWKTV